MRSKEQWAALFAKTGVADPEGWATAEVAENLGNLPRVAFLSQAWKEIPPSGDGTWLRRWIDPARRNDRERHFVAAYDRLETSGASPEDLVTLLRGVMGDFLFRVCYLLDDPSLEDSSLREAVQWGLYEESDVEEPVRRLGCIHELVHSVDPETRGD